MATTFAQETDAALPIYYRHCHKSKNGYVYARNALATRVFAARDHFEPYVMNSARLRANGSGDYDGTASLTGSGRVSFH